MIPPRGFQSVDTVVPGVGRSCGGGSRAGRRASPPIRGSRSSCVTAIPRLSYLKEDYCLSTKQIVCRIEFLPNPSSRRGIPFFIALPRATRPHPEHP